MVSVRDCLHRTHRNHYTKLISRCQTLDQSLILFRDIRTTNVPNLRRTRRISGHARPFALENRGAREWREGARKQKFRSDPDRGPDFRPFARFAGKTLTSFVIEPNE